MRRVSENRYGNKLNSCRLNPWLAVPKFVPVARKNPVLPDTCVPMPYFIFTCLLRTCFFKPVIFGLDPKIQENIRTSFVLDYALRLPDHSVRGRLSALPSAPASAGMTIEKKRE